MEHRTMLALVSALLVAAAAYSAPAHPRIFLTAQDIPRLRAMATDNARNALGIVPAEAWKTIQARADEFLATPFRYSVTMPGMDGGPSKVWEYTLSKEAPPRHDDYTHYPCWTGMFQERTDAITTRLQYLLLAHIVSGERRYLDAANAIVLDLCAWPIPWTDPSYRYGEGKPELDCGHCATWVGIFYDWTATELTPDERELVRKSLIEKALLPIDRAIDSVPAYHNWNAVIASGLGIGATALLGEDPRADAWVQHAIARAKLYFDAQGKDGGPMEGPMYGTYAADCFADMIWALSTANVPNDLVNHPYIRSLPRYCISLLSPNNLLQPCFGDGGPSRGYLGRMMLSLALRGDPESAWYCQQADVLHAESVRGFIALDPARIRPKQPTFNPSGCFVDVGYAILRDGYRAGGAFLAMKTGPPTAEIGHNHYDSNSFVINWGRGWPAWDPGYRDYFDPPKRRYTVGTLGHNSIVLDLDDEYLKSQQQWTVGHDQVRLTGGRITEFCTGPMVDYTLGSAAETYNTDKVRVLDRFDRQIVFVKPGLFFIRDTLAAPQEHAYSFLLHLPPGGEFEVKGDQVRALAGRDCLQAHVFSPPGISLRSGTYPGAEEYGPYLAATTGKARAAVITSVIVPRNDNRLIVNPGFEQGMAGWSPRTVPGFAENHVIDTVVKHTGEASARIDNSGYYYTRHFSVPPGARITARWWAKCTSPTGASSILYYWKGNVAFARTNGPVANANEWRQYEFSSIVPEGTQDVCLALQYDHTPGQCWYDDVEVTSNRQAPNTTPARVTALDRGAAGAVATVDGITHVFLCGKAGQTREIEAAGHRFVTDAELAVVSIKTGGPTAWILRGTKMSMDGRAVPVSNGEWQVGGKMRAAG